MSAILTPRTLERLSRLDVGARRAAGGGRFGERASGAAGAGTIFREHRTYSPGDDLRYVDWNAYGRLRSLFVKVFELEENLDVHLLVDATASMGGGRGSKLEAGLRAAALVGATALGRGDVVRLSMLPGRATGALAGPAAAPLLFRALAEAPGGAREPLADAVRKVVPRINRRGFALLVTDFLDESASWRRAVAYLRHLRVELVAVHVVAAEERSPSINGRLRLEDAESGDAIELDVDDDLLARYRRRFEQRVREIRSHLGRHGVPHVLVDASKASDAELLRLLVREGVLR